MNDLVWLKRESWEELFHLLKNIQIRQTPCAALPAIHFTGAGKGTRIFLDLPDMKDAYYGYFKVCKNTNNDKLLIGDGSCFSSETAGYAYINGIYTEIPAKSIDLDETLFHQKKISLKNGRQLMVKEAFLSLCLDPAGKVSFKLVPEVTKRVYDGEFAVEYSKKQKKILILDGSDAKSGYAGRLFRNGKYIRMPSGALEVQEGTLCIFLSSSGKVFYKIIQTPSLRIYDGEFLVEYNEKSNLIDVFDGMYAPGNQAGHVYLDGKWKTLPAASLEAKEGYLCIKCNAKGDISYVIVKNPSKQTNQKGK